MSEMMGSDDIPLNTAFEVELMDGYGTISAVCLPAKDGYLFWVDLDATAGGRITAVPVTMTKRLRRIERKSPFTDTAVIGNYRRKEPS